MGKKIDRYFPCLVWFSERASDQVPEPQNYAASDYVFFSQSTFKEDESRSAERTEDETDGPPPSNQGWGNNRDMIREPS